MPGGRALRKPDTGEKVIKSKPPAKPEVLQAVEGAFDIFKTVIGMSRRRNRQTVSVKLDFDVSPVEVNLVALGVMPDGLKG